MTSRLPALDDLVRLAVAAGQAIMPFYRGPCAISTKADASPVTEADRAAEAIILAGLRALDPALPVIAEEEAAAGRVPQTGSTFVLVDPLDGTREFVAGRDEFTVNIAIVDEGVPVRGVVYAPALGRLWAGDIGTGAWRARIDAERDGDLRRQPIAARQPPAAGLVAVASRSHRTPETDAYLARFTISDLVSAGSSLKFCLVAEGKADLYPRLGRTMEWDTAAGHAVLRAAGGEVLTLDGLPLTYGKRERGYDNPHFVAVGRATDGL
ncbi:3'(2'),5'-bisphosphate nucleotidase CysQ [Sphingomonas gilva]|uniref:3'(2'),5'-bisphosphate nucleotidase CysQ n=1 Tax=Sphingomonas gilva TaxID=2305907 RepID=UPI001FEBCE36|nr:3'(2'),5'-bisphosphate nucleotidase CysQ [Sphingomonas gilva]